MNTRRSSKSSSLHQRLEELKELIPELEQQADELSQSRRLQSALFEISELSHTAGNMPEFFKALHVIVAGLIHAENLLVAVIEPESGDIRFVYHHDIAEPEVTANDMNLRPQEKLRGGLTYHVIKSGKVTHLDGAGIRKLEQGRGVRSMGVLSHDWLGVPLSAGGTAFGCLAVQSYDDSIDYNQDDEHVLEFVCQHISSALQRKWAAEAVQRANNELEERVDLRTAELSTAIQNLEREIGDRRRAEQIQRTLFRIARLAAEPMAMNDFFAAIHEVIAELIEAKNLYVALVDEEAGMLRFPYKKDQTEADWPDEPLPDAESEAGPTMHVLRTGESYLFRADETGFPAGFRGIPAVAWVGVPLRADDRVIGVLAVQSYDPETRYSDRDRDVLTFVGQHVANAIQHQYDQKTITLAHQQLENRVEERTRELQETNNTLRSTLDQLKQAQGQLVQAEKLASLGGLVAGVAHEINTPLGVAVTATTHLRERLVRNVDSEKQGEENQKAVNLIIDNLQRASKLVRSFKQVAADQISGERHVFNLQQHLDASLTSLHPIVRRAGHQVNLSCPSDIEVDGYSSALYQIVSNLVTNSVAHGFDEGQSGTLTLNVEQQGNQLIITYSDDGKGVNEEVSQHLFEPFYTTSRSRGNTGLGMHIVFNLVSKMGGQIEIGNCPNRGVQFRINIPLQLPREATLSETTTPVSLREH